MARKKSAEPPQVRAIKKTLRAVIGPPETWRNKPPDKTERKKLVDAMHLAAQRLERLVAKDAWLDRRIRETETVSYTHLTLPTSDLV